MHNASRDQWYRVKISSWHNEMLVYLQYLVTRRQQCSHLCRLLCLLLILLYTITCLSFLQRIQFIQSSEQWDIGLKANLLLLLYWPDKESDIILDLWFWSILYWIVTTWLDHRWCYLVTQTHTHTHHLTHTHTHTNTYKIYIYIWVQGVCVCVIMIVTK